MDGFVETMNYDVDSLLNWTKQRVFSEEGIKMLESTIEKNQIYEVENRQIG